MKTVLRLSRILLVFSILVVPTLTACKNNAAPTQSPDNDTEPNANPNSTFLWNRGSGNRNEIAGLLGYYVCSNKVTGAPQAYFFDLGQSWGDGSQAGYLANVCNAGLSSDIALTYAVLLDGGGTITAGPTGNVDERVLTFNAKTCSGGQCQLSADFYLDCVYYNDCQFGNNTGAPLRCSPTSETPAPGYSSYGEGGTATTDPAFLFRYGSFAPAIFDNATNIGKPSWNPCSG